MMIGEVRMCGTSDRNLLSFFQINNYARKCGIVYGYGSNQSQALIMQCLQLNQITIEQAKEYQFRLKRNYKPYFGLSIAC